jgi:hypothetical protein
MGWPSACTLPLLSKINWNAQELVSVWQRLWCPQYRRKNRIYFVFAAAVGDGQMASIIAVKIPVKSQHISHSQYL